MTKRNHLKIPAFLLLICLIFSLTSCLAALDEWLEEEDGYETPVTPEDADNTWNIGDKSPIGGNRPTGRELGFTPAEPVFHTDSPLIAMIEINQGLSYGFDTDNGSFFLMENFVAGKETAIFVSFNEALGSYDSAFLTIELDGNIIAQLAPVDMPDGHSMLFHPRNMADVNHWPEGAYTFSVDIDGHRAVRVTNFYQSMPMKILAVPILANYSGRIVSTRDDWKLGGTMVSSVFPVARADFEYILGAQLDLSARRFDLDTEEGLYNVWEALSKLQTKSKDYTLVVGFIRDAADYGSILGYTFGLPATVVVEDTPDMLSTVAHEIAHCYNIGDEYDGGHLNTRLNSPPFRMRGYDINTYWPVVAKKEAVVGANQMGLRGTGAVIYTEQRPYWVEGKSLLGQVSSYMGGGMGADAFEMWTSSEKWNHLFRTFTGNAAEPGQAFDAESDFWDSGSGSIFDSINEWLDAWLEDDSHDYSDYDYSDYDYSDYDFSDDDTDGFDLDYYYDYYDDDEDYYQGYDYGSFDDDNYWGQCPECCGGIFDPYFYTQCFSCCYYVPVVSQYDDCLSCGADLNLNEHTDYYIECSVCEELIWEQSLSAFNSGAWYKKSASVPVGALEITGFIEDGVFVANPWYTFEAERADINTAKAGAYGAYIYDKDGGLLSMSLFDLNARGQITRNEGLSTTKLGRIPVDILVAFPEAAATVVIKHGDTDIYTRPVSNNEPWVEFTGLHDYQALSDSVTLTWEAGGADELFFELWYCPSEDEQYNIAANITERSLEVDLSSYPGSEAGFFYIFATDGVRTGETDSPWVKVPYKAPDIITEQAEIPEIKITEEILFEVDVYDMQDGWLWDEDEVVWMLGGREYMTGAFLWVWPYELAPGTHTFSMTATNSAGMAVSREYSFHILDDESDLPDDWSRPDIVAALANGFVLPLNRLDAAITKAQYAGLMTTLYGYMHEGDDDPYPDYVEGVVTDCGQDDYDEFMMVYLGLMDAPGGRFEPNKAMSQDEAALIMYRTMAVADPEFLDDTHDLAEIMELFMDVEVVDKSGPNAYQATKNLSNKLALVRLNRLFEAIDWE